MDPETQENVCNEFEKEMDLELESRLREAETSGGIRDRNRLENEASTSSAKAAEGGQDSFWDSDEDAYLDEWENNSSKKTNDKINDDLFYDPNMDDEDQKWVENMRKDYNKGRLQKSSKGKEKPVPNSDAVLNCPACFVTLTLDCQRHEIYETQYRAMFVMNCSVDFTQQMKYPEPKKKGKGKAKTTDSVDPKDIFNPVKCDKCSTQVAVYDREEVYHFFNVLASY